LTGTAMGPIASAGGAAMATVAAATLAVAAQPQTSPVTTTTPALAIGPIAVPVNGEVNGNARGILAPVSTWTFVNTDSYLIEYLPPGIVFDG
jgi:hypothetical protein